MKPASFLWIAALLPALAQPASAANITYTVNDTVGAGGVTGTIVTDGVIGTLTSSDILSFNLLLNDGTGTSNLSNVNGLIGMGGPDNLTATSTALLFNFNGNGGFLNFFDPATCSPPEWSFETTGSGSACNGTAGNEEGISAVIGGAAYSAESGDTVFANVDVSTTPEPSSLMLLGTGLAGALGMARRRLW